MGSKEIFLRLFVGLAPDAINSSVSHLGLPPTLLEVDEVDVLFGTDLLSVV